MPANRLWAVTGAAGFLGSHVVDELRRRGQRVLALDDLSVGHLEFLAAHRADPEFTFAPLDIRSVHALTELFCAARPWAVIHLAALHYIPRAVAEPAATVSLNVFGTQCVLSACNDAGVERLWLASTGDVYAPSPHAHSEDDQLAPFNIYGLSKQMAEQLVALEGRQRPQACFVIGRLFNLYGPRETNPHILPEVVKQLRTGTHKPLALGSLWPRRDLVGVNDAARAAVDMVERAQPGVTTANVGTGVACSMHEVIDEIGAILGTSLNVTVDPARVRPVERPHLQANVDRLGKLIGWTPHTDLRRGLGELLAAEGILG